MRTLNFSEVDGFMNSSTRRPDFPHDLNNTFFFFLAKYGFSKVHEIKTFERCMHFKNIINCTKSHQY